MNTSDEFPTVTDTAMPTGDEEETILDDSPRPAPRPDLPLEADAADALDQRAEIDAGSSDDDPTGDRWEA